MDILRIPDYNLEGMSDKKRATNAIEVEFTIADTDVEVAHEFCSREPVGWKLVECTDAAGDPIPCGKVYKGTTTIKDSKIFINLKSDTVMNCKIRFV